MRYLSILSISLVAIILAGCAKPLEVSSITEIKPQTAGAQGVDVYAGRRASGEAVPAFAGDQLLDIRSYKATEGGGWGDEFAGAKCKVTARDFAADFSTPAKVRVPVYRAQSSPLAVQCEHDGMKPRMVEVGVYNKTTEERMSAAAGAGAIGILTMAVVNAASDTSTHDFAYPMVRVIMEPAGPAPKTASAGADKS